MDVRHRRRRRAPSPAASWRARPRPRSRATTDTTPESAVELEEDGFEQRRGRERKGRPVGRYLMCVHVRPARHTDRRARGSQPHRALRVAPPGRRHPDRRQHLPGPGPERPAGHGGGLRRHRHAQERRALPGRRRSTTPRTWSRRGQARGSSSCCVPARSILCQVTKNPIGTKGARLTQEVSPPGPLRRADSRQRHLRHLQAPHRRGAQATAPDPRRGPARRPRADRAHGRRRRHAPTSCAATSSGCLASGTQIDAPGQALEGADAAVPGARPRGPGDPRGVQPGLPRRRHRRPRRSTRRCTSTSSRLIPELADRVELYDDDEPLPDLRALPRARAAAQGPRPQGVAALGRLADHRAHRGAHGDRRQHRQERRHLEPRGDRLPQQPGGGRGDRPPAAAARHRRHHRHRLHRHGDQAQPGRGRARPSRRPWPGTRPAPRCSTSPSSAWSR